MLNEKDIDILCISETWLLPSLSSSFARVHGYSLYRCDGGRGGGVCIYVRETLKVTVLTPQEIERSPQIEDAWISVQYKKFPSFIIGCVYRHPHATCDSFNYLSDILRNMCLRNKNLLVLGDFNDDYFQPDNRIDKIVQTLHLHQLSDKPTRITRTSSTLIDLIITNNCNFIISSDVIACPVGDHEQLAISLNIKKEKNPPQTKTFRTLKEYSPNLFCNLLLNESQVLNGILNTDDVNKQVPILTNTFMNCLNTCAPFITKEIIRPPAPWIDSEVKEAMKKRDALNKEFKLNKQNNIAELNYRQEKKRVNSLLSDKKKNHYRNEFIKNKGNMKGTWKVIDKIIPKCKKSTREIVDEDHDLHSKAEDFNKYFAAVGENAYKESQEQIINNPNLINSQPSLGISATDKFRPQPIDINSLILIIKHLRPTNSYGSDGMPYRFLIDSLPILLYYILIIVNTSIVTGIHTNHWKNPLVVPTFKSGDPDSVSNYRPICLLPILSKILEKVIAIQLMDYLESNKLLTNAQHGFRPNLSTETALLKITNTIYENTENKKISLLILLDLSKAFDSVSHPILLNKMSLLNIDAFWFDDYLKNRFQSVRHGPILSSPIEIRFGVPQGSILGPILFIILINDILQFIHDCLLVGYADDTQLLLEGDPNNLDDLIDRAKNVFIQAKRYFNTNGLLLNENKTQFIFFGSKQYLSRIPDNIEILFGNAPIKQSKKVKNLGIYMDNGLTFHCHIDEISKKVIGTLIFLNRVWDRFQPECRVMAVQALILSTLNYCLLVWGSTNKTQLNRVQKLLNFAARVAIGGAKKRDHVSPLFEKLKWLKMESRFIYKICILIFKSKNNILPEWFLPLPTVSETRNNLVNTRHQDDLYVPRTITNTGARNLNVIGPKYWNQLPKDITDCRSFSIFKTRLMQYLFNNQNLQVSQIHL